MDKYTIKWGQETIWVVSVAALGVVSATVAGINWSDFWAAPATVAGVVALAVGRVVMATLWNQILKLPFFGSSS